MKYVMTALGAILITCAGLAACGGSGGPDAPVGPQVDINPKPRVLAIAPSSLSVGDELTIVGADFIDPTHGAQWLAITGKFFDQQGAEHPVALRVKAQYHDATRISWRMWPNVVFHPEGDQLGYFLGDIEVINHAQDGTERVSDGHGVRLDVKPSLIVRALRPAGSPCSMVVSASLEDTPFAMAVEAIGIQPGTADNPLTFTWMFPGEFWDVGNESTGTLSPSLSNSGTIAVEDRVTSGTISGLQDAAGCTSLDPSADTGSIQAFFSGFCRENASGQKRLLFRFLDDVMGTGGLKQLRTRELPICPGDKSETECPGANFSGEATAPVTITAVDGAGNRVSTNIQLDVFRQATVKYDSSRDRIVNREEIRNVGSGGTSDLPASVSYDESTSETKSRDKGLNLSPTVGGQVGFIRGINFTVGFGIDVRVSVSSSIEKRNSYSQEVPPGYCVTFYRQAEQIKRLAAVTAHDACGNVQPAGDMVLLDWQFSFEVASDPTCPARSKQLKPAGPCTVDCEVIKRATSDQ